MVCLIGFCVNDMPYAAMASLTMQNWEELFVWSGFVGTVGDEGVGALLPAYMEALFGLKSISAPVRETPLHAQYARSDC